MKLSTVGVVVLVCWWLFSCQGPEQIFPKRPELVGPP